MTELMAKAGAHTTGQRGVCRKEHLAISKVTALPNT